MNQNKRQIPMKEVDYDILIIGNKLAGKTSIKEYICTNSNTNLFNKRLMEKNLVKIQTKFTFQVWDVKTFGEKNLTNRKKMEMFDAVVVAVDIFDPFGPVRLPYWFELIINNANTGCKAIVMLNKYDLVNPYNKMLIEPLVKICNDYGQKYFFTSTITGENIIAAVNELLFDVTKTKLHTEDNGRIVFNHDERTRTRTRSLLPDVTSTVPRKPLFDCFSFKRKRNRENNVAPLVRLNRRFF